MTESEDKPPLPSSCRCAPEPHILRSVLSPTVVASARGFRVDIGLTMPEPVTNAPDQQIFAPIGLSPRQILSAYDASQWEHFVEEWTHGLKQDYAQVQRFSGAGDKGRDVVGFVGEPSSGCEWDNYQCKHYSHPLAPSDVYVELGKLCFYTHRGDFIVPRRYRFVAPHEVGPKLKDLLLTPTDLRTQLMANWSKACERQITDAQQAPLAGDLLHYVERFDFSIVGYVPLLTILDQHKRTQYWAVRFPNAVPARPTAPQPPSEPDAIEAKYVRKLLDAYGNTEQVRFNAADDLNSEKYRNHLRRSRQWFFQAEGLNRFSRDNYPAGVFDRLKQQVLDGVIDVAERNFGDGYERVCATTDHAATLTLANSPLAALAEVGDKKGICHHLANEDQLEWVR